MKGLNKAFRAVLALSLVLCMVMSCVTVSAATPVTLSAATVESKGADGLYEVKYTVSDFAAAEGDATIFVYSGEVADSLNVAYAGQEPVVALAEGFGYEFTMDLEGGSYTVFAGGTGMGKAEAELVLDTAPAFADVTALAFNIKTDAIEVGPIREAADYDGDAITYAVESDVFEVADGKIVVKTGATLAAGTYDLILTAAANGVAATNSVPVTIVVEDATIVLEEATASEDAITVAYNATEEAVLAALAGVVVTSGDVVLDAEWAIKEGAFDGSVENASYVYAATLSTDAEGYAVAEGLTVEVTVTVAEKTRTGITAIAVENVELAWGEAFEAPKATVTFEDGSSAEWAVAWDEYEVNVNEAGVYNLTGEVVFSDDYKLVGEEVSPKVAITVTVAERVITAIEVPVVAPVAYNGTIELPETTTVTFAGGEEAEFDLDWTEDDAYSNVVPGTYKFVAAIDATGYNVGELVTTFNVDVVVEEDPTIYITAIEDLEDIEIAWGEDCEIPATVGATFSKETDIEALTINWENKEIFNNEKAGVYELVGEVVVENGYALDEGVDGAVVLKITVGKPSIVNIPTQKIYVLETDSYNKYVAKLNTTIEGVTVEGQDEPITIENVVWPASEGEIDGDEVDFPPHSGESIIVKALDFTYSADVLNTKELVPAVEFITVPETFTVKVNNIEKNSVVTVKGESAVIAMNYADGIDALDELNERVVYEYAVTSWDVAPEWFAIDGNTAVVPAALLDGVTSSSAKLMIRATIPAECFEGQTIEKYVTVYREADLFSGQMYFNASTDEDATEEAKYYSALRVNRMSDLKVVFDVKGSNGAYDFAAGTFTVTATKVADGTAVEDLAVSLAGDELNNGRGVIVVPAEKLAGLNGAYTFKVAYAENDTELFAVSRTTHVENKGLWFSSLSINKNATAVGITINKKAPFSYVINYDGTNAEGKVYAGYEITEYGTAVDNSGAKATEEISGNTWSTKINAADKAKGTYTLYSYANLTDSQNFYDMAYGRTIYLFNGYTNLCNLYLEGSTNSAPVVADGDLEIAPHWGGRAPEAEGVVFECKLTLVDKNGAPIILLPEDIENGTVDENGVITFAATDTLTIKGAKAALNSSKVTATIELYAGADAESMALDASRTKDFWTAYIATK